jgi:flagellar biogenesis protein FliO
MKAEKKFTRTGSSLAKSFVVAGMTSAAVANAAPVVQTSSGIIAKTQSAGETASSEKIDGAQKQMTASLVPPIPAADPAPSGGMLEVTSQRNPSGSSLQTVSSASGTPAAGSPSDVSANSVQQQKNDASPATPVNLNAANLLAVTTPESNKQSAQKPADEKKTTPETAAGQASAQALIPNGAALQSQLLPLAQNDGFPWSGLLAGGFLILGIAAAGVLTVRLKQGRGLSAGKAEKQLQLITTMSLSPKRQIMLVRIRDKEVALASTEHGITLLTELNGDQNLSGSLIRDGGDEPRRRKVQQKTYTEEPVKLVSAPAGGSEDAGQETAIARSEMLMGALKNLREKNLRNRETKVSQNPPAENTRQSAAAPLPAERKAASAEPAQSKTESTMKQTRAAFPKYLANAFEQESKRALPQNQNQNSSNQDEAGNVTNMIRERLKELRPLS